MNGPAGHAMQQALLSHGHPAWRPPGGAGRGRCGGTGGPPVARTTARIAGAGRVHLPAGRLRAAGGTGPIAPAIMLHGLACHSRCARAGGIPPDAA
jgi:hypothetical protein